MSANLADNDRLSGLAQRGYLHRRAVHAPSDETGVKLAELKVETSYVRRDLDEVMKAAKETRTDLGQLKEAMADTRSTLKSLPTYKEMFLTTALLLSVFAAVIVFADKIRAAFGL